MPDVERLKKQGMKPAKEETTVKDVSSHLHRIQRKRKDKKED